MRRSDVIGKRIVDVVESRRMSPVAHVALRRILLDDGSAIRPEIITVAGARNGERAGYLAHEYEPAPDGNEHLLLKSRAYQAAAEVLQIIAAMEDLDAGTIARIGRRSFVEKLAGIIERKMVIR